MHAEPSLPTEEDTVPPGDDSNTDPTPPLPADPGRNGGERHPSAAGGQKHPSPLHEEPQINNERDIPSDGRDPEGEAMIRDLDKPTEPGSEKSKGDTYGH